MRTAKIGLTVLLVIALAGCAGKTFVQNTYGTIYSSGIAYNSGMMIVSDLQKQGKITQTQRDEINKIATTFYAVYHSLVDSFGAYIATGSPEKKVELETKMKEVDASWSTLASSVNTKVPNTLSPQLVK